MHLAENMEKAARMLKDPWIRELMRRAQKVSGRGIVRVVKDMCEALNFENAFAESVRNTAIFFRDYPDVAQKLLDQFESEQAMIHTNVVEKKVLVVGDLHSLERFPLIWRDQHWEIHVSEMKFHQLDYIADWQAFREQNGDSTSVMSVQSGFVVRVGFPPRYVREVVDFLRDIGKVQENFLVCGVHVRPSIMPHHDGDHFKYPYSFEELFLMIRSSQNVVAPEWYPHREVEVSSLNFIFTCGPEYVEEKQRECLRSEDFRNAYMLACLKHFFGI